MTARGIFCMKLHAFRHRGSHTHLFRVMEKKQCLGPDSPTHPLPFTACQLFACMLFAVGTPWLRLLAVAEFDAELSIRKYRWMLFHRLVILFVVVVVGENTVCCSVASGK